MARFNFSGSLLRATYLAALVGAILPLTGWRSAFGQIGQATTVQLPTFGVAIDAEGVLSLERFDDPRGELRFARIDAARQALPANIQGWSDLRKVSLVRLEQAIRTKLAAGQDITEEMSYLAGLQRVEYVFIYPDTGDIIIAGPAEGWAPDPSGRRVGMTTFRPVLELVDLCVALRQFPPGSRHQPFIGCTINPRQEGLARLVEFQRTIPSSIPNNQRDNVTRAIAEGTRDALGDAEIQTFGIAPTTHFAHVLIEADYRMKLIGIGLEEPPVRMATFMSSLRSARSATLQRWWFTPNYDCVRVTEDRLAMQLVGQGVQLLGEDKLIGADGVLAAAGAPSNRASAMFTTSFTEKYEDIATVSPVYAQMRNMIDLAVAAAYLREHDAYGQTNWRADLLLDEQSLATETLPQPQNVPCAVNVVWKGNRLFSPAGGGVSIRPLIALEEEHLLHDEDGTLAKQHEALSGETPEDRWWWD